MTFRDELLEAKKPELHVTVLIGTSSRSAEMANRKLLSCRISVTDVLHSYGTTYSGYGSVTFNEKQIKKYGLTEENLDDVDLYRIIHKEFIKNKKFTVEHIETSEVKWWDMD